MEWLQANTGYFIVGVIIVLVLANGKDVWAKVSPYLPSFGSKKKVSAGTDDRVTLFEAYLIFRDGIIEHGAPEGLIDNLEDCLPYLTVKKKEPTVDEEPA